MILYCLYSLITKTRSTVVEDEAEMDVTVGTTESTVTVTGVLENSDR